MLLPLSLSLLATTWAACPTGFQIWYEGICGWSTFFANESTGRYDTYNFTFARETCQSLGADLPSVHSLGENNQLQPAVLQSIGHPEWLNNLYASFWLGLECHNSDQHRWLDGTPYDFEYFYKPEQANCTNGTTHYQMVERRNISKWEAGTNTFDNVNVIACTVPDRPAPCGEFGATANDNSTCYTAYNTSRTWTEAVQTCAAAGSRLVSISDAKTNDVVRRTAVINGLTQGLHIGLKNVDVGKASNWSWNDGTPFNYSNFASGYPMSVLGNCVAMDIRMTPGRWKNVDCEDPLPFLCARPLAMMQPSGCPTQPHFTVGENVYSPSFPASVEKGTCEYLIVAQTPKARVGVRVSAFSVSPGRHELEVWDNSMRGTLLAKLTGDVAVGTTFTSSAASMRLVWNATASGRLPGWHFTVFETL